MSETTKSRLKDILTEDLDTGLSKSEIGDAQPLFEDGLGLDSIVIMDFIALVEKRFEIEFDDDELNIASFSNLEVLSDLVEKKKASNQAQAG